MLLELLVQKGMKEPLYAVKNHYYRTETTGQGKKKEEKDLTRA